MVALRAKAALLLVLAALAGGVTFWLYLPDVKQLYWSWLDTNTGGERHGRTVFRHHPRGSPYDQWLDAVRNRIPVFEGLVIEDVTTVPLRPWPEMGEGVNGLYLRFADYQISDGRLLELSARGATRPQRHLFEMGVYFLDGPGHTLFFRDGQEPVRADWRAGSLVSIPLNVRYQHVSDADRPVRLLAVTSFPFALNAYDSEDFVFGNTFDFSDRYTGEPDYFRFADRAAERRRRTNLVPDVTTARLEAGGGRGDGRTTMSWEMTGNTVIDMHVSEMPPRTHMKAHRHSTDAFLLILAGEGYSLIWVGDQLDKRQRINWRRNTLLVPPTYWYHQHFNAGPTPSRHLAINSPVIAMNLGLRFYDQIERDSRAIRAEWAAELERREQPTP